MFLPTWMRTWPIWLLPLAGLAASAPTPAEHDLDQLTGETFSKSTAEGVWLVEHFSPSCRHCIAFEPTWRKLAANHSEGINLAQVNCIVWGDLCNANKVTGYPQIILFKDGKQVETFEEDRTLENLQAYAIRHARRSASSPLTESAALKKPQVNTAGEVVSLDQTALNTWIASPNPSFIKFFAPWCGHCKKLAPVFSRLASDLRNQVNVGEVDCDRHPQVCKAHNVQGYPTLVWFAGNALKGSEYNGKRTGEALREFAATATKDPITKLNDDEELPKLVKDSNVLFLWTHSKGDSKSLALIHQVASTLLGVVPVYTSSSQSLREKYHVAEADWALTVLKDGQLDLPAATFTAREFKSQLQLEDFARRNSIPSSLELESSSFQRIMSARHKPLVVIVPFDASSRDAIVGRVREVAKKWASKQRQHSHEHRDVVFTWMDADRWTKWLKNMYGYKLSDEAVRQQRAVIADHSVLEYFDKTATGAHLTIATSGALFSAIESVLERQPEILAVRQYSQGRLERLMVVMGDKAQVLQSYIVSHPFQTVVLVIIFFVVIFIVLQRALREDEYASYPKDRRRLD